MSSSSDDERGLGGDVKALERGGKCLSYALFTHISDKVFLFSLIILVKWILYFVYQTLNHEMKLV